MTLVDLQGFTIDVKKSFAAFDFNGGQRWFDPSGVNQNVIEVTNDGVVQIADVFVKDLAEE